MKFDKITFKDKSGSEITLRNAQLSDAKALIDYLGKTAAETPFTAREPGEVDLSVEQEEKIIQEKNDSPKELMLLAFDGDRHIGNCSLMSVSKMKRFAHRASVAIALYKDYWNRGIGTVMMTNILDVARRVGYEQAELEVISTNQPAISLYESLGFEKCGEVPHCLKYQDGTYADAWMMVKKL